MDDPVNLSEDDLNNISSQDLEAKIAMMREKIQNMKNEEEFNDMGEPTESEQEGYGDTEFEEKEKQRLQSQINHLREEIAKQLDDDGEEIDSSRGSKKKKQWDKRKPAENSP